MAFSWLSRWPNQRTRQGWVMAFLSSTSSRRKHTRGNDMKFLGFYPETAAARIRDASVTPRVPTLVESLGVAATGFCLICTAVFTVMALSGPWLKTAVG